MCNIPYVNYMDNFHLSNVEIVLLLIIQKEGEISGYDIKQVIEDEGFSCWADVGKTSIYMGLKKLEKKFLIRSYIDIEKKGRGAIPRRFSITDPGLVELKKDIFRALSSEKIKNPLFDIGISGIPLLNKEEAILALEMRIENMSRFKDRVDDTYELKGGDRLPFQIKALFEHIEFIMRCETQFIDSLIKRIREEKK